MSEDTWWSAIVEIQEDTDPFVRPASINIGAMRLKCSLCGGTDFHLARADYETVVRCISCRNETSIHQG